MFDAHFMIRADDRTLQEAPNALNAVSVNIANNPFFGGVINPLVLSVRIFDSPIRGHFIGVDRFRVRCGVVMDKLMKHSLSSVRDDLQANHAVALDCSDSDSLVPLVTPAVSAHLPADVRFIHFYNPSKKLAVNLAHGSADAMAEIPSGFISNIQRALHLQRRHAFLRFGDQVDCQKPLRQWKVGIMEDCSTCCRKLVTTLVAVVLVAINYSRDAFGLAARASNTLRPAKLSQSSTTLLIVAKLLNQFRQIHFCFEGFGRFFHKYA